MTRPVADFLFNAYTLGCPLVPLIITGFWLKRQKANESGKDAVPKKTSRRLRVGYAVCFVLFGLYLCAVLDVTDSGTLYDFLRTGGLNTAAVNLIPFSDQDLSKVGYILNVIMLMPFGFFVPLLFCDCRRAWVVTLSGALFSVLIESSQLLNYRSTDVDDVLMNTCGAFLGYLAYRLFSGLVRIDLGRKNRVPHECAVLVLSAFLGKFFLFNGYGLANLLYT